MSHAPINMWHFLLIIVLNSKFRFLCVCSLKLFRVLAIGLLPTIISNSDSESRLTIFLVERLLIYVIAFMQKLFAASVIFFILGLYEYL